MKRFAAMALSLILNAGLLAVMAEAIDAAQSPRGEVSVSVLPVR